MTWAPRRSCACPSSVQGEPMADLDHSGPV
ncbi:hypothetical protein BJ987_003093 [Nocardia goodfellowii]|uniref:Uncharacterized protein n=1 Tax=Nocardia goodfellowii TaxID=882446 RepID=A0ABS4QEQ9_9NOCA|nr:hypothetical protein [Nocardia goodfellowii]